MSEKSNFFTHPLALVEGEVGEGTRVWAWAHVMKGAKVGAHCNVAEHCFIEAGVVIGDRVIVKNGISVWNGVIIEDGVFLGPHMIFTNEREPRSDFPKELGRTLVCKGASIGAGAIILCGVTIGKYATVGAGAVVTHNVFDHSLVYGSPARQHGWVCECGLKLLDDNSQYLECRCGRKYELIKVKERTSLVKK